MCGVGGVYYFNKNKEASSNHVEKMMQKLIHRGPDNQTLATISKNNIMFHTRLSIIDISKQSNQPFCNTDGSYISYNGEIYNYKDLKYPSRQYHTMSDTEVLAEGFQIEKMNFLSKVNGMYAFAFWDMQKQKMYLGRDQYGIKPLYYYIDEEKLIYASEIKSILQFPGVSREIDREGVDEYFKLGYIRSPRTGLKYVKQLKPGEILDVDQDGKYNSQIVKVDRDYFKYNSNVDDVFANAVESHLVADVPITIFLSGGLDSTVLAEVANPKKISGFTTFKHKNKSFDETDKASLVAKRLNLNLRTVSLEEQSSELKKILYHADDLICDPALVSNYNLFKGASTTGKVGISGDGADEMFLGYHTHKASILANNRFVKMTKPFLIFALVIAKKFGVSDKKYPFTLFLEKFIAQLGKSFPQSHMLWRTPGVEAYLIKQPSLNVKDQVIVDLKKQMFECDMTSYLEGNILKKVDRMSMAHSFEARVPYLSPEVFALAQNLSSKEKMNWFRQKIVLRKFLKNRGYNKEIYNQKKMGFGIDLNSYFNKEQLSFCTKYTPNFDNYINVDKFKSLVNRHKRSYLENYQLFCIMIFKYWLEEVQASE